MIRSIRYFLLISLLLSITIASVINGIGNYILDEQVIQPFLDSQLIKISSLLDILGHATQSNESIKKEVLAYIKKPEISIGKNIVFQVWDQKGLLILHSNGPSLPSLKNAEIGFSDITGPDGNWRVYATYDTQKRFKIIVGEVDNIRHDLADDIARSNAYILLVTYPLFALLVWAIVTLALRSITRVTTEISNRASTYLEPVQFTSIPNEIRPLVEELNQLFIRLKLAFERNKRFAGDAAHELRTPLAALKTHVQVALKTTLPEDRDSALEKIIESVDRSSHVVAQLLILSRLGDEETLSDIKPVDLYKLSLEIIAYLAPSALEKNIEIELAPAPAANPLVMGNDTAMGILIRNIVDNAIRYTPPQGAVKIVLLTTEKEAILRVTDTGPGIPIELRERVFERFYRILGTTAPGSGLGLAIVSQIAALHHAKIYLNTPPDGKGLQVDIAFPRYRA